ncbi:glyoxylate/hydroxypyruvate reductase HPR3-like [Rhododendron vialii]|uniref:glyoxylate/hydroxypyruvate reductase HPR3-like n=1 Tax=Rhododendron vialii TaxID=182163 RepID=UPI00265F341E|nr:glyoxylate/hydroxypyruvate reductase HPR3-like [Rhododendron vialii]
MAYRSHPQPLNLATKHQQLPKVLIIRPPMAFKSVETEFSQKFHLVKAWESPLPLDQFLAAHAHDVRAMIASGVTPVNPDVLRHLPSLRCIVTSSAGIDQIDLPECRRRGIVVANAGAVFSEDVADTAVALLIDVLRRVVAADRYVRGGNWLVKGDYPLGSKLGGKRVGIVGLGSIGMEVAKRLEAFGCTLSYYSRKAKPSVSFPFYSNVCELATNCDILILCCALNDQTHHMINKEVLLALGKEGVIVNIARGAVIDEKELVRFLVQGDIAGAGLDVFENEPEVPRELFPLDNVVLSPHRAVFTEESIRDSVDLMLANLEAFFSNKPLLSPVENE